MVEIRYMGVIIGTGNFVNFEAASEVYVDIQFSDDSMKELNGHCLEIDHGKQAIIVWDDKGKQLFASELIRIPFFRKELLKQLTLLDEQDVLYYQ
ncbi:hypothetical protein ABHN11_13360 [Brevibacillus centrosporus]|jgi:hypothetical protein|uniref:hypothetical protein n=1 Tax=Brevibacillus centrosporus TaxID=54910 RepID=UPI003986E0D2